MNLKPQPILLATRNPGKIREFSSLLEGLPVDLHTLSEFPQVGEIAETGATFVENASLKAQSGAAQTAMLTLADDSGLEVDALGGAPGVLSARYAGRHATDEERFSRLLNELQKTGDIERRARFVSVIALADPMENSLRVFTGTCEGRIAHEPRGANGFGYDPVFIPEDFAHTFGELPPHIKDRLSHRAHAVASLSAFLRERFAKTA